MPLCSIIDRDGRQGCNSQQQTGTESTSPETAQQLQHSLVCGFLASAPKELQDPDAGPSFLIPFYRLE